MVVLSGMEQQVLPHVVEVAKGIGELGMLVIAAASFVIISLVMMIFIFRWFMRMINNIFNAHQKTLDNIMLSQTTQENKLDALKESMTGEVYNQVRVLMRYALEFNQHAVCTTVIGNVKEKNGLDNRKSIEKKTRALLTNLYKTLKTDIDTFRYNGRRLSEYCLDEEWLERVYNYCLTAIYDGNEYHRERYLRELGILFEGIRLEFFENLKNIN